MTTIAGKTLAGTLIIASILNVSAMAEDQQCSYFTYSWNIYSRKPGEPQRVVKSRSALTAEEIDPVSGCTVCEEDQITLTFEKLPPFKVCRKISQNVITIIEELQRQEAPLSEVIGYRVGKTRGAPDANGNRTGFSNHSYGIALDVNSEQNGLYDNCEAFGQACRLIKGGVWNPADPRSLTASSATVRTFKSSGFQWGGEIAGKQKDFMHFSLTGY